MKKSEPIKLQKGYKLHFESRHESEEIIKSSNNRQTGMIKTDCKSKKRINEYSVDFVLKGIEMGSITLIKNTPEQ